MVGTCELRAAAVSELVAPGRWLLGGELLMTAALLLPMTPADCDAYLADVGQAGVVALALGLGSMLPHQDAPPVLRDAARRAGMPLLTVPDGVPFIAVTTALFSLQAEMARAELDRLLTAQRAMTAAAVEPGGVEAILAAYHHATGQSATVINLLGLSLGLAGPRAETLMAATSSLVQSVSGQGLAGHTFRTVETTRQEVHPLGSRRLRGWLLTEGLTDDLTSVSISAALVSVLTLEMERRHALDGSDRRHRAQVLHRLSRTGLDAVDAVRALASVGIPPGPARCAAIALGQNDGDGEQLASDLAGSIPDTMVRVVGLVVELCSPAAIDLVAVLPRLAPSTAIGIGGVFEPGGLPMSLRQARSALEASRLSGTIISAESLTAAGSLSLLPLPVLLALSDMVLGPLLNADRSDDLLSALDAFLAANGNWEVAAAALHVHRQTVRNRIALIEKLTGRSLSQSHSRLEFGLALLARSQL